MDIELEGDAQAGLLLFYSKRLYCGLGFDARGLDHASLRDRASWQDATGRGAAMFRDMRYQALEDSAK